MFDRLIKLVREEKVSLFIGAGFSIEAKAPSVSMLCENILAQLDDEQLREKHKNDSLPNLAEFFVEDICCGSRNSLIDSIQNLFYFEPAKMDDHQALARIPHFHNIFTTNYDTLLEDSYEKKDCQVIRKDADCTYIDKSKPVRIFKIHGDFVNQDFVVITANDFKKFFKRKYNPLMWNVVKNDFLTTHILFIGYSLSDNNIIHIIRNISKTVKKNKKDMFLIAPGLGERKHEQLREMGVHYYDAKAKDFLNLLTEELKKNIGRDFRHHKVSTETFSRFCRFHNIDPVVCLHQETENQILKVQSTNGADLHHEIKMTMDAKYKEILEKMDFEKNGIIVKNSASLNIPSIRFTSKELKECSYVVNGVVICDEISEILISPEVKDFSMTIRIPSRNFMEKVIAKAYKLKENKVAIDLDCHTYKSVITLEVKGKDYLGTHLDVNFNFTFKDSYTNNNEAIKWMDLLCAFSSNEDVFIKELSDIPFKRNSNVDKNLMVYFNKIKEYYENVKQIEMNIGKCLATYNQYTEEAYRISRIIVSYYNHLPISINTPNGLDFSIEAKLSADFVKHADKEKNISIVSSEEGKKSFKLNEWVFEIPYIHNIFKSCVIRNVEKKDDGYMKIDLRYSLPSYLKLYSDKPVDDEFPDLKILEECKDLKSI